MKNHITEGGKKVKGKPYEGKKNQSDKKCRSERKANTV